MFADNFFNFCRRSRSSDLARKISKYANITRITIDQNAEEPRIENDQGRLFAVIPCSSSRRPNNTSHYDIQSAWYLLRAVFHFRLFFRDFSIDEKVLDLGSRILAERVLYGDHNHHLEWLSHIGMIDAHDYFEHPYSLTGMYLAKIDARIATVSLVQELIAPVSCDGAVVPIQSAKQIRLYGTFGIGEHSSSLLMQALLLAPGATLASSPTVFPGVNIGGVGTVLWLP